MLHPVCTVVVAVATSLEDVVETYEVRLDVGVGIGDGVAHTGLSREVDDNIRLKPGEELAYQLIVGNIAFYELPCRVGCAAASFSISARR